MAIALLDCICILSFVVLLGALDEFSDVPYHNHPFFLMRLDDEFEVYELFVILISFILNDGILALHL